MTTTKELLPDPVFPDLLPDPEELAKASSPGVQARRVQELGLLPASDELVYLAEKILGLSLEENPNYPNVTVNKDMRRLYINPVWVAKVIADHELPITMLHEVLHIRLGHAQRWGNVKGWFPDAPMEFKRQVWGVSCNWEINGLLIRRNYAMPVWFDLPRGKLAKCSAGLAETTFENIMRLIEQSQGDGDWPEVGKKCNEGHGSQLTGNPGPWERQSQQDDCQEQSDCQETSQETEEQESKGKHPGHESTLSKLLKQQDLLIEDYSYPWGRVLANAVGVIVSAGASRFDYTYQRRSRRQLCVSQGIILPGVTRYAPQVSVIIDCSSSMDVEQLNKCVGTLGGLARAIGHPLNVLYTNTHVQHHESGVLSYKDLPSILPGGGTELESAFPVIKTHYPGTTVIVILTDGENNWREHTPLGIKMVVGLVEKSEYSVPGQYKVVKLYKDVVAR